MFDSQISNWPFTGSTIIKMKNLDQTKKKTVVRGAGTITEPVPTKRNVREDFGYHQYCLLYFRRVINKARYKVTDATEINGRVSNNIR